MRRIFLMFSLLLFSAFVGASPSEVLIIRHAEKPTTPQLNGKSDGRDLSPQGYQRAQALVKLFTLDARMLESGPPVAIYAGSPKKPDTGSIRPLETIQPTAHALGLNPNTNFISDDYNSMVNEVMTTSDYEGKTVLISWPHDQIPEIASLFGVDSHEFPSKWDGSVFDRVWKIKFDKSGKVTSFEDLPQHVLPGDSAN
jgi:hypothetical protein